MRKLLMIASAAAMAVAMPALAKGPGGDKGHGNGHGGGGKAAHGPKGHGGGGNPHQAERRAERQQFRAERKAERGPPQRQWAKAERREARQWRKAKAKAERRYVREERRAPRLERAYRDDRLVRAARQERFDDRPLRFGGAAIGYAEGCPPGLAKKRNGCLPPGQAKKLYRVGEALPLAAYGAYNLPDDYRGFYYDTPDYSYRYDDGYIYRVNNETSLVSALIPLLGGGFGVGSLLPAGYDVYNVPYQYRDDYYDTPDAYYRYGDDAIYQVDPQTQMIQSVVALLAGDLNVGSLLPGGYDVYNLPMDYRDQYVDSDDAWYRYADGNIYEVDPQTRMIESIVAQLV